MSTVSPEIWRRAAVLFERALDQPRGQRVEFLRRVCGADDDLRTAVESLLALDEEGVEESEAFLDPCAAGSPQPSQPPRLEGYRLLEPIAQGGMGRVWLAERTVDDIRQRVAVKLMEPAGPPGMLRLFRRERQILARLAHPDIARFLDGGTTDDGTLFVVMEYVEGTPVTEACDARRLGVRRRLELFLKICRVVQYAHESLVVHSDLKPRNILVTDAGEPKLLDFGIAKLLDRPRQGEASVTQGRFFTPEYASPEQISGQAVSTASDIYSLGVILYELLTGRPPYDLLSLPRLENRNAPGPPPPSDAVLSSDGDLSPGERAGARNVSAGRLRRQLRGDVDAIVLRCLRVEPRERYRSVEQLAEDLRRHLAGLPVLARPGSFGYRAGKLLRRHWRALTAAAVLGLSLVALFAVLSSSSRKAARERDRFRQAQAEAEEVTRFLADSLRLSEAGRSSEVESPPASAWIVRDLLDQSAARLDELRGQPRVQARLMRILAEAYADLGLYEEALPLLHRALETQSSLPDAEPDRLETARALQRVRRALGLQ